MELIIPRIVNRKNEASAYKHLCRFDVGLAPLLPVEMQLSRPAFQLKPYFSCGVPAIGSMPGENGRFLINGKNGVAAEAETAFRKGLFKFRNMSREE